MKLRKLGRSDLQISPVGLGTWAIGNDFWGASDDAESIRAIQAGIDAGINLIDTTPAYGSGHSEKIVGEAIKGRRDKVIVATKLGVRRIGSDFVRSLDPKVLQEQLEESLRLLGTDVIDLYQIHWPVKGESEEAALELMDRMKKDGKIRAIGVSNFTVPLLQGEQHRRAGLRLSCGRTAGR